MFSADEAELRNNPRYQYPLRLPRYAFQVNSQNGEDGIIQEIFRRIGTIDRVFLEIGIGDGVENNTAFLLSQGWRGFWIDGNDAFQRNLSDRDDLKDCLTSRCELVTQENIVDLLRQMHVPSQFDFLSLDVDQNTFYIWQAMQAFRPRVIAVEYNASVPPPIDWKARYQPDRAWDGTQNFGASLKALEHLARQQGYSLVGCDFNGVNAFFVQDDLVGDHFAAPFTAENHYEPPRYTYTYRRGHPRAILDRSSI